MYGRKYNEDTKLFKSIRRCSVKCKCGHSIVINNKDKVLCNYCGHYVYNKRKQFREKMKEILEKDDDVNDERNMEKSRRLRRQI